MTLLLKVLIPFNRLYYTLHGTKTLNVLCGLPLNIACCLTCVFRLFYADDHRCGSVLFSLSSSTLVATKFHVWWICYCCSSHLYVLAVCMSLLCHSC